jgi:hypothetical protein
VYRTSTKTSEEGKYAEVFEKVGVPKRTLRNWLDGTRNRFDLESIEEVGAELKTLATKELFNVFDEMDLAREDANYRDLVIGAGILIDKIQLLSGNATQNTQVTFSREGFSTLPEPIARRTIEDNSGTQEI